MILRQPKPKIVLSLTPLIDVVFILLIFFMLVSQFSVWREIKLMSQPSAASGVADQMATSIQLRNDGSLRLKGMVVTNLSEVLAEVSSAKRGGAFVLFSEDGVQIQRVMDVIADLSLAGISDVRLVEASSQLVP